MADGEDLGKDRAVAPFVKRMGQGLLGQRWLLFLLLFVAVVQVFTMPSMFYPGDNFASRMESMYWLERGEMGIPYSERAALGGMVSERGQYLYENDDRQMFFSRYGFGNVVAFMLPCWLDKVTGGKPEGSGALWSTQSLLLWINIVQIVLTLISACYLYLLARLYTERGWLAALFVVASFYSTFLWHYLRAPAHEIYLIFSCLGAGYHFLLFMRRANERMDGRPHLWLHLLAAVLYCWILVSAKLFFVLFAAVMFVFCLMVGREPTLLWRRITANLQRYFWRYVLYAGIAWGIFVVGMLLLNWYRFETPLSSGYDQWLRNGQKSDRFAFEIAKTAFPAFFIQMKSKNLFMHYPLLAAAVLAFPVMAYRRRLEAAFLGTAFVLMTGVICCYSGWAGEWSYGPRHLIPYLPLVSVAVITGLDAATARNRYLAAGIGVVLLVVLSITTQQQVQISSLHPFVYHYTSDRFQQGGLKDVPQIKAYHDSIRHRAKLFHDVRAHAKGERSYPPYRTLEGLIPSNNPDRAKILAQFDGFLKQMGRLNYWFAGNAR